MFWKSYLTKISCTLRISLKWLAQNLICDSGPVTVGQKPIRARKPEKCKWRTLTQLRNEGGKEAGGVKVTFENVVYYTYAQISFSLCCADGLLRVMFFFYTETCGSGYKKMWSPWKLCVCSVVWRPVKLNDWVEEKAAISWPCSDLVVQHPSDLLWAFLGLFLLICVFTVNSTTWPASKPSPHLPSSGFTIICASICASQMTLTWLPWDLSQLEGVNHPQGLNVRER